MKECLKWTGKYPVSVVLFMVIWYLSFFTPPQTRLEEVPLIDKWAHMAMYGGTCLVLWIEYRRCHQRMNHRRLALLAWAAPIAMSGVIELLQAYCTGGRRSGEWLDFAANSIGVTLAAVIGLLIISRLPIGRRGSAADERYRSGGRQSPHDR